MRIIEVERWQKTPRVKNYNPKLNSTYQIRGNQVTGLINQIVEPPQYDNGVTCDPLPTSGTFVGKIENNVITGTWEVKVAEHKMHFSFIQGKNSFNYDRTDSFSQTFEIRLVLKPDGTLSETSKGSQVTKTVWGPTAPKDIANKSDTFNSNFEIPDNEITDPLTGTWKERK